MQRRYRYLGAGIGMGAMMIGRRMSHRQQTEQRLGRKDLPFAVAMVALDIAAPILMMYGLHDWMAAKSDGGT